MSDSLPPNVTSRRSRVAFIIARCDAVGHHLSAGGACPGCIGAALATAAKLEREACARVAERGGEVGKQIAGAIRARGSK